jgi:hypothetical protein
MPTRSALIVGVEPVPPRPAAGRAAATGTDHRRALKKNRL